MGGGMGVEVGLYMKYTKVGEKVMCWKIGTCKEKKNLDNKKQVFNVNYIFEIWKFI